MKNQKGITLVALIIIIVVVCLIGFFINGKSSAKINWGYMPSTEYYELRVAIAQSELSSLDGSGKGVFSKSSFETLGRDVKKAGGKWFNNSSVNFKASISDEGGIEITTLSDGEHTATFSFDGSSDYVSYTFKNEDHTGYRITIR